MTQPLSDEEIGYLHNLLLFLCVHPDYARRLCAQAREANRLRGRRRGCVVGRIRGHR